MWRYLFIETNTSMAISIIAENYKTADKELDEMNVVGDWRYDSKERV